MPKSEPKDGAAPTAPQTALQKLNPKHRRFVLEYFAHRMNASAAALAADYKDRGEGYRLLQRPDVAAAVAEETTARLMGKNEALLLVAETARLDPRQFTRAVAVPREVWIDARRDERVHELAKRRGVLVEDLDEVDLSREFGDDAIAQSLDGRLMVRTAVVERTLEIDWEAAEKAGATSLIRKLKQGKDGSIEAEFHDPLRAQEMILKAHGAFTDRLELGGVGGGPVEFEIVETVVHVRPDETGAPSGEEGGDA